MTGILLLTGSGIYVLGRARARRADLAQAAAP
jgi:hypothetical protein